jgi:hypothetical protein
MTSADRAQAPTAPGRLGEAIPAADLLGYLSALTRWRGDRRQELDRIDAAALQATDAATYTSDVTLAMTIWQSISDRLEKLNQVWDSGRVGPQQREEISRLIWGTGGAGLGLSLVEATRLSDALTASLRARLAFDPVAADVAARIAATRATLQRCAEALAARRTSKPDPLPDVEGMRRRLEKLAGKAAAGSDVRGPLAVIEGTAARAERDLIMAAAGHQDLSRDYRAALERRHELESQAVELRALVALVISKVTPTPRLAVPDVDRLGRVPQTKPELDAYRARLDTVAAALAQAHKAYAAALSERDDLRGLLLALAAKASATGRSGNPVVGAAYDRAREVLWSAPCSLPQARELVAAYQSALNVLNPQSAAKPEGGSSS